MTANQTPLETAADVLAFAGIPAGRDGSIADLISEAEKAVEEATAELVTARHKLTQKQNRLIALREHYRPCR